MAKVDMDLVKLVLQRQALDVRTVAQVLNELEQELQAQQETEKDPVEKKQFVMLVSDPHDQLPPKTEFVGWVLQVPEDASVYTAEERLHKAAYAFNRSPKGRRFPVKKISEICEHVPARFLKEEKVWVKNKEAVSVLKTLNQLPSAPKDE